MDREKKLSCYLMGHQSRLIQCGEILMQKGHEIKGVISDDKTIKHWAGKKHLPQYDTSKIFLEDGSRQAFDLFLSIDNFLKVENEILKMPKIGAINFHDGPLPKYAGSNATNWAILCGEDLHGISWHQMTDLIDAGDIFKKKVFEVSKKETAFSLNMKCYEESLQSFGELIDEIAQGIVKRKIQNLEERTFFSKWKRPYAACTVHWGMSAEGIETLFRALSFDPYPNPIGLPKVMFGDEPLIIRKFSVIDGGKGLIPGQVTNISSEGVRVATVSKEIEFTELESLNGDVYNALDIQKKFNLEVGDHMHALGVECEHSISRVHEKFSRHEGFWENRLKGEDTLDIPYARRGLLKNTEAVFSEKWFDLPKQAIYKMVGFEQSGDFLLTALILYLFRLCGTGRYDIGYRDSVLKTALASNEKFFSSHIPLRVQIDPKMKISEFQNVLINEIHLTRNNGSYLRDLIFRSPSLKTLIGQKGVSGLPINVERIRQWSDPIMRVDCDLLFAIPDNGVKLFVRYDENRFEKKSIERMLEQFEVMINACADEGEQKIFEMEILPDHERKQLSDWNETDVEYPHLLCLHDIFERQVDRTPCNIAIEFKDQSLTYQEFNNRANQLAWYLRKNGVRNETLVGVFMERSLEMVISLYGIIKAGGAYVPLDPEYPFERVSFMVQDTQVPVILTLEHLKHRIPNCNASILCLDTEWSVIGDEKSENLQNSAVPDNLAYVIYTSGSTGIPKGVMNEHRGVVNRLLWMQDKYVLTEEDCVVQKTPFTFDVSVWEFFWPLLVGSKLVIAPPGVHKDPAALIELIIRKNVTTIHFVPSMLQIFLREQGVESCDGLKRVICSGEALPYDLQARFFQKLNCELHNLYGPTEAAVDVTYWKCVPGNNLLIVPIGFPVANTKMYVLDDSLNKVPIGVPGELHIGGVQVARGYLNRQELTAEKFIPDPFAKAKGARLYKTGDLARYLPNGAIEYLGRNDFQVKIRGMRIELGEIESLILKHPDVSEVVAVARDGMYGDKMIIAYFVANGRKPLEIPEIRNYLKNKLPDYMVPAIFVQLDELPLLENGKVDRKALPEPSGDRPAIASVYVGPKTETEKKIAKIWRDFLGLDGVGINDNFFELGGNSLLLVRILNHINESICKDLRVVDLIGNPTISSLASYLKEGDRETRMHYETAALYEKKRSELRKLSRRRQKVKSNE